MTVKPLIKKDFNLFLEGSLPIIISAPHGGKEKPTNIKDRDFGVFDRDDYTKELCQEIIEEFFIQSSCYPYVVIMDLDRKKVDANRALKEAVNEDNLAISSYETFHSFIKESKKEVERKFGKGIYLDIHGQSHSHGAIELGYLLTNDLLRQKDLSSYQKLSSISNLEDFSPFCFNEQIRGNFSLGTLLEKNNYKTIPSKNHPFATKDEEYFEGAYNTKTHCALDGSNISAIQVEFPYYCRENKMNRKKVAKAFVLSILEYMEIHFNINF